MPPGVRSNIQADNSAIGNPSIAIRMKTRSAHGGASNAGKPIETACTASQATTRYAPPTLKTLRRLSSSIRLMRSAPSSALLPARVLGARVFRLQAFHHRDEARIATNRIHDRDSGSPFCQAAFPACQAFEIVLRQAALA